MTQQIQENVHQYKRKVGELSWIGKGIQLQDYLQKDNFAWSPYKIIQIKSFTITIQLSRNFLN